jgi:hypothetical protein
MKGNSMSNVVSINPRKSRKPASVNFHAFGHSLAIDTDKLSTFLDLYEDQDALDLLDSIKPVERAWVYRALGA